MQVNHGQLKKLTKRAFETMVPVDIKGPVGIGKSEATYETAKEIAHELKKRFVFWNRLPEIEKEEIESKISEVFIFADLRLSQFDQTDLKGFPMIDKEFAKWKPTLLFKILSNPEARGIVFFDEANLATPSVLASCYSIINDHLIGETPISMGVMFITAGNKQGDTNNAFDDPPPLNNRRINVELVPPTVDEWTDWAAKRKINSSIIGYLQWKQTNLYKYEPDHKDPSFPTPRMWVKASKLIEGITDESELKMYIGGCVGEGTAREVMAFIKLLDKIDVKSILENPELIKKYDAPDMFDTKYAILSGITEVYKKDKGIMNKACGVIKYLEPEFGMFLLRMMKGMHDGKEKEFVTKLVQCSNFKDSAPKYLRLMAGE